MSLGWRTLLGSIQKRETSLLPALTENRSYAIVNIDFPLSELILSTHVSGHHNSVGAEQRIYPKNQLLLLLIFSFFSLATHQLGWGQWHLPGEGW